MRQSSKLDVGQPRQEPTTNNLHFSPEISPEHRALQTEVDTVQRSIALLGMAFLLLMALGVMFFISSQSFLEGLKRQEQINEVLPVLRDLYSDLLNAETGQRGYLLTGNTQYLTPYEAAKNHLRQNLTLLAERENTLQALGQPMATQEIRRLTQLKLDELANTIRLKQEHHDEEALTIVKTDAGKHYMDDLRQQLDDRIKGLRQERKLLTHNIAQNIYYTRQLWLLLASMLVICVVFAMHWLLRLIRLNRQLMSTLRREATHDALTGLPNRRYFFDWLTRSVHQAERTQGQLAVFFIDLDGFKSVNDNLGHEAGDDLLREVSSRFQAVLRNTDLLCRIGGDEFAVVVSQSQEQEDLYPLAQRMIQSLQGPVLLNYPQATVGASIGVARFPVDNYTADGLLAVADERMYQAKQAGKGQVCMA